MSEIIRAKAASGYFASSSGTLSGAAWRRAFKPGIGNKTNLLPIILPVFPKEFGRYIEIFGGSGAVLLGKEPSKFEVYNDIEGELVNFFRVVKNRPAELLLELDLLPLNSREEFASWLHFHDGGNEPTIHLPDQVEIIDGTTPAYLRKEAEALKAALRKRSDYRDVRQAAAYLKRVRNSYSSSGRSFACQPFSVRTLFTQIREMSQRLENVIIEQQSFEVLIPHYDREDAFFYGDPPYYDSEYVYDAEFGWDHHVLLRDTLARCKGKWLISQVDCPEIRYLFKDYEILDFQRIHAMVQKYAPGKQFGEGDRNSQCHNNGAVYQQAEHRLHQPDQDH